jgi:hypothetical protein
MRAYSDRRLTLRWAKIGPPRKGCVKKHGDGEWSESALVAPECRDASFKKRGHCHAVLLFVRDVIGQ